MRENDGYNRLVLTADLAWRDVAVVRALSKYLRQAGIPFSEDYMWRTLNNYPAIHGETGGAVPVCASIRMSPGKDRELGSERLAGELSADLEDVSSLDDDRILRRFQNAIGSVLRTNFYQLDTDGQPKPTFAFKIDSRRIDDLPQPRPFREIFVYSPRVEGVHLRFGMVARGGLRWSDRPQDFRHRGAWTGQGAAGQERRDRSGRRQGAASYRSSSPRSATRDAWFKEGTESYKIFINALLDVTDNLDEDRILPPERVQRFDVDDPYLVVAADKGTATFSDTANGISEGRNFWLGDAFASGGSAGYDHKKMGITARGAWEGGQTPFPRNEPGHPDTALHGGWCRRHVGRRLRQRHAAVQGDQAGRRVRSPRHFHRSGPGPGKDRGTNASACSISAGLPGNDYNTDLISRGGGIFSRQLKSIPL